MELISWNVNGINSCCRKALVPFIVKRAAAAYCFQEVKVSPEKIDPSLKEIPGYTPYFQHSKRKGYSGVLTCSATVPLSVIEGIGDDAIDSEGRVLTLEYTGHYLVNAYFPNSNHELSRLGFKIRFNELMLSFCQRLRRKKHVIICGDFNVAHKEMDLRNPKENQKNAGFTVEERESFTQFLGQGYADTFRDFTKGPGHYTWWSYRFNARARDIGWRVDYFVVNRECMPHVIDSFILKDIQGSDHCPIGITIKGV